MAACDLLPGRDRNSALGPGILIDGELGYTWVDSDPEEFVNPSIPDSLSDYDGFEFGIGTNITF